MIGPLEGLESLRNQVVSHCEIREVISRGILYVTNKDIGPFCGVDLTRNICDVNGSSRNTKLRIAFHSNAPHGRRLVDKALDVVVV